MTDGSCIHVLHVVPTLGVGGIELALARVVRGLVAPFRHSVACLTGGSAITAELGAGVDIHCLRGEAGALDELRGLRALIRDTRPSMVHARNVSAWLDVGIVRATLRRRPPLVLSFHGTDRAGPWPRGRRLAAAVAARSASRIFTVSTPSRELLVRVLRQPPDRIAVIPNGVDTSRFAPPTVSRPRADRTVIGTVGNLTPVKNQRLLVLACAEVAKAGHPVALRIAGEGPEREGLLRAAEAAGIADHVELPGHVDDVVGFLHSLDLFVLPSDSEAHPNALIEAMACGLPCIASRVGGIPEVLVEPGAGRLFERGDLPGLTRVLVELIEAPEVRDTLGRHARRRVVQHYSVQDMIQRYRQLYTEVACA